MGAGLWLASPLSEPSTQMSMVPLFGMVPTGLEPSTGLLGLVGYLGVVCHCHSRLTRLLLNPFFYFAKSNSSQTLIDLIFPLILSIHVTFILSYPSFHDHCYTLLGSPQS